MPNPQLIKALHAYVKSQNLIASLRAVLSDEEVRQPDAVMGALYGHRIDTGEALATLEKVMKRLEATAEREGDVPSQAQA